MSIRKFVQPSNDRVLVRRLAAVTEVGGMLVPEASQEKPNEGNIVAIGPEVLTSAFAQKYGGTGEGQQIYDLGDHVLFGKFAGVEVEVEGEHLVLLKVDELMARIVSVELPNEPIDLPVEGEVIDVEAKVIE